MRTTRTGPLALAALLVVLGLAAGLAAVLLRGGQAAPTAEPTAAPSPSITLRAADGSGQVGRPAEEPTAAPSADGDDAAADEQGHDDGAAGGVLATVDDAAGQQAYDTGTAAVLAVVSQPAGESAAARHERLAPLFTAGSPTPGAAPAVDLAGIGVVSDGRVDAAGVAWAEPFEGGNGRIGFLVAVTADSYGVREDGGTPIAWKDTSTQLWKVLLTNDGTAWVPQVAYLADQDEPSGADA
jgi:hypothetical protein